MLKFLLKDVFHLKFCMFDKRWIKGRKEATGMGKQLAQ